MRYHVSLDGRTHVVDIAADGVTIDGRPVDAHVEPSGNGLAVSALVDGRSVTIVARRAEVGEWSVHVDGRSVRAEVVDERTRQIREMTSATAGARGPRAIRAPMPGMIVRVEVEPGQHVRGGDGLVIVEAMKMENELRAEVDARVSAVHVQMGDAVEKDQVLVEFEAPAAEDTTIG